MMKRFIVLIFPILLLACNNDSADCCVNIDVNVDILYQNQLGENLIDSSNMADVKIYYKDGTNYNYAFQSHLDYPNMHYFTKDAADNFYLTVFPSDIYEGNFSTTLVELNENTVDTLYCEFDLSGSNQVCKKVWVNGVEMSSRNFTIVK